MQADHFEAIWSDYSSRLRAFIRGRVPDETQADDLLQEVFLRVHTGLCCREAAGNLQQWIYRVTRNLLVDHYRRRRPVGELSDSIPATASFPAEDDPRVRLSFSLHQTIAKLPEPYREALVATEIEGLSQQQLAQRAGISLSGAKSRVQRARQRLRELLLGCCHFELDRAGRIVDYHPRCRRCLPGGKAAETAPPSRAAPSRR